MLLCGARIWYLCACVVCMFDAVVFVLLLEGEEREGREKVLMERKHYKVVI